MPPRRAEDRETPDSKQRRHLRKSLLDKPPERLVPPPVGWLGLRHARTSQGRGSADAKMPEAPATIPLRLPPACPFKFAGNPADHEAQGWRRSQGVPPTYTPSLQVEAAAHDS